MSGGTLLTSEQCLGGHLWVGTLYTMLLLSIYDVSIAGGEVGN